MYALIATLVFVTLTLLGYAAAAWLAERADARRKLAQRLSTMAGSGVEVIQGSLLKDQRLSRIAFLNTLLGRMPVVNPVVRMIRQAGLKRRVGEVLLYIPLLAGSALMLNALIGGRPVVGLIAAIIAGATPLFIVARLRRQRMLRFAEQLPEALDLIRSALQAGHGVPSAMSVVADTFTDPIAYEFRYMVEEMKLGLSMREALQHLAERVDDPNLPILTVGILVASDSGGNLAEVIDNIAYTIRERFKLIRETRVLTAQGRLSGMVLTALPFLVATFMAVWNPRYFKPLLENRTGHYMIAYGLFSLAFGHWFIQRIVRIRV